MLRRNLTVRSTIKPYGLLDFQLLERKVLLAAGVTVRFQSIVLQNIRCGAVRLGCGMLCASHFQFKQWAEQAQLLVSRVAISPPMAFVCLRSTFGVCKHNSQAQHSSLFLLHPTSYSPALRCLPLWWDMLTVWQRFGVLCLTGNLAASTSIFSRKFTALGVATACSCLLPVCAH